MFVRYIERASSTIWLQYVSEMSDRTVRYSDRLGAPRQRELMPTKLGTKINQLRTTRGLSLDGLAAAADVSKSYLWELENREVSPTAEKLKAIAAALEVEVAFLLDDQLQQEPQDQRDRSFFRKYSQLEQKDKEQLRRILDTFKAPPRKP